MLQRIIFCLAFLLSAGSVAQFEPSSSMQVKDEFLPVDEAFKLNAQKFNDKYIVSWIIAPTYYLYGEEFSASLVDADGNSQPLESQWTEGVVKYDEIFEENRELLYNLAEGEFTTASTNYPLYLTVTYQGCAEAGLCYPPKEQTFKVTGGGIATADDAPTEKTDAISKNAQGHPSETPKPLLLLIGLAMAGGLILNLMPCVLPVLSIKIMSLTSTVHHPHMRHLHGYAYAAGVIVSFLVVASVLLGLRAAGEAIGWGFQLQSPGVIISLAALFFVMGLSLSGYIELGTRLMGIGSSVTPKQGLLGSFWTGMLATMVASPCTAPFMGTALGAAVALPTWQALSIFVALGFGMALPFILLCHLPALLDKMPKPGNWMNRLKEILAFPLYLTAVWLLSVLGTQNGIGAVAWTLAGAVGLVFIIWTFKQTPNLNWRVASIAAVGLLAIPILMRPAEVLSEQAYSPETLSELRNSGDPVFVNLTADWCFTCKINEKVALQTESVKNAMRDSGMHYLVGDWTNPDPQITALLTQFGRNGVPLYLVYPQGGGEPQVLPQLLTEGVTLEAIKLAINGNKITANN